MKKFSIRLEKSELYGREELGHTLRYEGSFSDNKAGAVEKKRGREGIFPLD